MECTCRRRRGACRSGVRVCRCEDVAALEPISNQIVCRLITRFVELVNRDCEYGGLFAHLDIVVIPIHDPGLGAVRRVVASAVRENTVPAGLPAKIRDPIQNLLARNAIAVQMPCNSTPNSGQDLTLIACST